MTVRTGIWRGFLVGVCVVPDGISGGVVAGPATRIYTIDTGIGSVHTGMDTLAEVSTVNVTEIAVIAMLVTAVVAAKATGTATADNFAVVEVFGLGTVYCVALVATAVETGIV